MTLPSSSLRRASVAGVALVALLGLAACSSGDDSSDTTTTASDSSASSDASDTAEVESTDTDVVDLKVGDCMDDSGTTGAIVSSAGTVPCDQAHTDEIFAQMELEPDEDGNMPSDSDDLIQEFCLDEFATYVGVDYNSSSLDITWFEPTMSGWSDGDRQVLCIAESSDALTASVAGSGL